MIPNKQQITQLLTKYAPNDTELELITTHGQIVAEIALECAKKSNEKVDLEILEAAALIHDIGSYPFLAANYYSEDYKKIYAQHALLGAKILEDEGVDVRICKIVETHVLLGLTEEEIRENNRALPYRDYEPDTIEGRLVCYADRFHSKKPVFNSYETFYNKLLNDLPKQAQKMKDWAVEFGIPDVVVLAKKYNHPVV